MEIRNLLTFIEVANLQNFTQASRVLGYSQSNISAQIRQLEKELGVVLFERMARGVHLTQYGCELLPIARDVVALSNQMGRFAQTESEIEGVLRIGVVESIFHACFQPLVISYARRFPKIKLELTVDGTMQLQDMVQKNQLDVACIINDLLPQSKWTRFYDQKVKILLVARRKHPLAQKEYIMLPELSREKCIMMENSSPYVAHFYHLLAMEGVLIDPFLTLQSAQMASQLIQQEDYVSFLPEYTVKDLIRQGVLCELKTPGYEQWQSIQLISCLSKVETRPLLGYIEEAKSALNQLL